MEKILVIGASGHAKVIIEALELNNNYKIHGLLDSFKPLGTKIFDYEILGTEKDLLEVIKNNSIKKGVIAIGDNWKRFNMAKSIQKIDPDFEFITVIHPSAVISKSATIDAGSVVLASVNINADAKIGKFCILNTDANFGHDCKMDDYSSLAPSVSVGGNVHIGKLTAISIGATIIHNIKIGKYALIGAGAVVVNNIQDNAVAMGIPAKKVRNREKEEEYLTPKKYELKVICISDEEDENTYKDLIDTCFEGNIYYSIEYIRHFVENEDQLFYFVLYEGKIPKIVMPFILRKIDMQLKDKSKKEIFDVITPYGYNGPCYINSTDDDLKKFWKLVDAWYEKNNVVSEFIRFSLNNNYGFYSGQLIESLSNVKGLLLDSFDAQWKAFASKVRNNFRKAINYQLNFKIFHKDQITEEIVKTFYTIYLDTMKRNNANDIYYFSFTYFKDLVLPNPDKFSIAIAYLDDTPISVELIINQKNTLFAFLGGTNADYFSYRPNDFLRVKVIEWAISENYNYYVLGGGIKNKDGLYKNKKALFPKDEDVTFFTGRKIIDQQLYDELCNGKDERYASYSKEEIDSQFFPFYRS